MKIKAIYSVIIYALLGTSCRSDDKQSQNKTGDIFETQVTIESKPAREPIDEVGMSGEAKEALNAFKSLYVELLDFKDSEDFKRYGFMIGGPYNNWLKRVDKLKENEILITKDIIIGDLEMLGLQYVGSKGKETEVTQGLNKIIYHALNPIKLDNQVALSGRDNYEIIKSEYQLFGRWTIINSVLKANDIESSYTYEIYKKGNGYIGVIPEESWEFETEILERIGNDFFIKGDNVHSKSGEYYRINSNMEMILFDQDGDLSAAGYTATRER